MPEGWSKLRDVDALADAQATVDYDIPLQEFARARLQLADTQGSVRGQVRFSRDGVITIAEVQISGAVGLICQRCLRTMRWAIDGGSRVALVGDAREADQVPEGLETVLAPGRQLSIRDLVEEELLLLLPIVPRHPQSDCGAMAEPASAGERNEVHRPFERLGELLKRDH
jgi:uncharacterized protein